MNAQQAREIAEDKLNKPLKEVLSLITSKAKIGEFQMWWYKDMPETLRQSLRDLGYTVGETQFDRNDKLTLISW